MPGRALRDEELVDICRAFGSAARRARDAGADGVQLHAAHGYLLSRMLSPLHNRRRDDWGGNFDRRLALLDQALRAIRSEAGADFPIAVKLNAHDGEVSGGLSLEQSARIAARLERSGVVAIEVSAGTADVGLSFYPNRGGIPRDLARQFLREQVGIPRLGLPLLEPLLRHADKRVAFTGEAYFLDEARRIAEAVSIPVIAVGGIRSRDTAERILDQTRVSLVSLARPLVRQPDLARRWEAGGDAAAACTSCNRCYVALGLGRRLRCRTREAG
jgi:2,4-dienoyl-CoA reductase-like NADH-dependent reductase (Old Yellow Enzyme family)